jgi:hypothetical protein
LAYRLTVNFVSLNCGNKLPCRRKSEGKLENGCREETALNEKPQREEALLIFRFSFLVVCLWAAPGDNPISHTSVT